IHTHPDFGIFLSEYDKFIHENFFTEDYQIAYVVDPIQKIEGFYFWINGKLEKCKGFYVYDKTGVEIDVLNEKDKSVEDKECEETLFSAKNIALVIMGLFIVFLLLSNMSQSAEIKKLQQEQKDLIASANSSLGIMQQQINTLSAEVSELKKPASKTEEGLKTDNTQNDNEILNKTEDATEDVNSDLEKAIAESATEGTTEGVIVPDNEIESYTEGVSNSE
ncbi:MAG: hypothetical protein UD936_09395, partial [Acutalibacteraceae bacterium]|nr:hypothetical protein [Acutalibacteraceae bacterium]